MKNVAIVYWSGTGNTESMAKAIKEGVTKTGTPVDCMEVDSFQPGDLERYGAFAFGCPAMGDEVLEEGTFEPFFAGIEHELGDRPVALFGSYGWGGGAWMRDWESRAKEDGIKLIADGLDVENGPTDKDLAACEELGKKLVKALG